MIEKEIQVNHFLPQKMLLTLLLGLLFCGGIWAQDEADLGAIAPPVPSDLTARYTYDASTNRYILSQEIGGYPINVPLVLTVKEYEAWVLKEQNGNLFQEKVQALSGRGSNIDDTQKNLLPELYVNNKFFESIFGSNTIDISPQGLIEIDLGYRYQKNEIPLPL